MIEQGRLTTQPTHSIELYRALDGTLEAEIEGKRFERVRLSRSFAFSMPDSFISIDSHAGEKLILILNLNAISDGCRELAYQELNRARRITRVTHIESIERLEAEWVWKVQTDEGPTCIGMSRLEDNIHVITPNRRILTDDNGRRFDLADIQMMDTQSQYTWNMIKTLVEPERHTIFFE